MAVGTRPTRLAAAALLGLVFGIAAAHALFLGGWTLVPWGVGGLVVGLGARPRSGIVAGAVYGFVLSFAFMVANYHGSAPVLDRVPFFGVFGIIGAGCGLVLGGLGSRLRSAPSAPDREQSDTR
jgi:hypothetical protein